MGYKEEALDFLGITEWHKAGYTGKGMKIVSDEKVCEKIHPDVISPVGFKSKRGHGDDVVSHIKLVAPDATIIAYPFSGQFGSSSYQCGCADYIRQQGVHVFTTSDLGSYPSQSKQQAIQDCIDAGCIFFAAAGNDSTKGLKEESKYKGYIAIGGVKPRFMGRYKDGEPVYDWEKLYRVNYSAVGEELDEVTIAEVLGVSGTSHCAPLRAAMTLDVQQFFLENVGRILRPSEMARFVNDNLLDVDAEGFDINTGYGLFKLPALDSIDVYRYVEGNIDYGGFPEMSKTKICIDAGHGISTPGKRSPDGSLLEYEFNKDVAMRLKNILEKYNIEIVLTCYDDVDVPLKSRCQIANQNKCDYFVSIHANAHKEYWTDASGWEIHIISKGGKAENLAKSIHKFSKELGLKDRGIIVSNFQVLRDTNMPAVLIEHGFYTNKEECEKLKTDEFRQRCAIADAKGILEHLGIDFGNDINVTTKNEVTDANVGDLVLTIGQKFYTANGIKKESDVAPKIENGRTLVPIYLLRELGLNVEWKEETKQIIINKE